MASFFSSPAENLQAPEVRAYSPGGMASAESNIFGGINNLSGFNVYGQNLPQAQQITQGLANAPGSAGYLSWAQTAGAMGQHGGHSAFNAGTGMYGVGGQIWNTAMDPQSALYARTLQQVQDQSRAGQAARGVAMTPYGAGLEDQNLRNFNIDWQNQQLNRQIQGGAATGQAFGQAGQMQRQGAADYLGGSMAPYAANQQVGYGQLGALSAGGQFGQQASQIPQQQISDWQNYLGWGTGQQNAFNTAQANQAKIALEQEKQANAESSSTWSTIGSIAGTAAMALMMFSDRRVKDDVEVIGEMLDGTPIYSYRYKGDVTPRIGLMAQDVEQRDPDAVVEIGGIKAVNYDRATARSRAMSRSMDAFSTWG